MPVGEGTMLEGWLIFFRGLSVCQKYPRLWLLIIPPIVLNSLLFVGLFYLGAEYFAPSFMNILQRWIGNIPAVIRYLVMGLFIYVFYLFVVYFFNALGLLIGSFFYTLLASHYFQHLKKLSLAGGDPAGGDTVSSSWNVAVRPALSQLLRYEGMKFLVLTIGGVLLSLLGWWMPYLSFVFLAVLVLMLSYEYFDYAFEGMRMNYSQRFGWIRKNLWKFFSAGLIIYLILSVPLIGFLLSPVCVVGATDLVFSKTQGLSV